MANEQESDRLKQEMNYLKLWSEEEKILKEANQISQTEKEDQAMLDSVEMTATQDLEDSVSLGQAAVQRPSTQPVQKQPTEILKPKKAKQFGKRRVRSR